MEIPPLSERKEDVEELTRTFFSFFCEEYKINKTITKESFETLINYDWPGNVRELKNTIQTDRLCSRSDDRDYRFAKSFIFKQYEKCHPSRTNCQV